MDNNYGCHCENNCHCGATATTACTCNVKHMKETTAQNTCDCSDGHTCTCNCGDGCKCAANGNECNCESH
ncbi:4045_t:CDS:2 [Ambispora leptoticha]|uniref:4045_t:CDS:1 n=1 Tax=Ambispora leptoticha TaxID=144679 RepID=A0A9N9DV41_9GLOM|nr:4045_t:CDS:2 [Ambispora leptoticha]